MLQQIENREQVVLDQQYAMAGVKWYGGGVFHRETVLGDDMSANRVSPLVPGALIYNRLFAWKASFAVIPDEAANWCVSNEFPQFAVDAALATPEYILHYCLTRPVLDAVNRASAGSAAVSRNRLKESAFLDLDIALPPLDTQRSIVAYWEKAQSDATAAEDEAERIERDAAAAFLSALGFTAPSEQARRRAFAVHWAEAERWGLEWHQQRLGGANLDSGKYPNVLLGDLLNRVQYGTSDKANTEKRGVPVLRMNNIVDGRIDFGDLKHVPISESDFERV